MNVVRMLIERGADMAAENIFWETAIPMAMRYGKLEIARIVLIERGANVDSPEQLVRGDSNNPCACCSIAFTIPGSSIHL
jgi:ankyrin repeat protein